MAGLNDFKGNLDYPNLHHIIRLKEFFIKHKTDDLQGICPNQRDRLSIINLFTFVDQMISSCEVCQDFAGANHESSLCPCNVNRNFEAIDVERLIEMEEL